MSMLKSFTSERGKVQAKRGGSPDKCFCNPDGSKSVTLFALYSLGKLKQYNTTATRGNIHSEFSDVIGINFNSISFETIESTAYR